MKSTHRVSLLIGGLVLLTAVALSPVLRAGFIAMDDDQYVTRNPHVLSTPSLANARYFLTHSHEFLYHPLSLITFMFDHAVFGLNPAGYHAVNLVIHVLSLVLVFIFFRSMTGDDWRSAVAAALFAIHPLRVESVAWVSERKDVLAIFFSLLAFLAYVRFAIGPNLAHGSSKRFRVAWYGLMVIALLLSLLAKPALVTFPFLLLVLDYWPLRRLAFDVVTDNAPTHSRWRPIFRSAAPLVIEKLPLIALVIFWAWLSRSLGFTEHYSQASQVTVEAPAAALRLSAAPVVALVYLINHVRVWTLAIPYPMPPQGFPAWQTVASLLALVAMTAAAAWHARSQPWILAGWIWFLISLAPFVGIVYIGDYALADRYTYLADIGLFFAIVWSLPAQWSATPLRRRALACATAAIVATLATFTYIQAGYWHDNATLFGHAVRVTEGNATAYVGLAIEARNHGDHAAAIAYYTAAQKSAPDERIYTSMASEFTAVGDEPHAIKACHIALQINPGYAVAHYQLGISLLRTGDKPDAIAEFQQALTLAPDYADASRALADLHAGPALPTTIDACRRAISDSPLNPALHQRLRELLDERNDARAAIDEYRRAIQLDSNQPMVQVLLGYDLAATGSVDKAIAAYHAALRLAPAAAEAHLNLGLALQQKNQLTEAAEEFRAAAASRPTFFEAFFNLGVVLERLGRRDEAATAYRRAQSLHPDDPDARAAVRRLDRF